MGCDSLRAGLAGARLSDLGFSLGRPHDTRGEAKDQDGPEASDHSNSPDVRSRCFGRSQGNQSGLKLGHRPQKARVNLFSLFFYLFLIAFI